MRIKKVESASPGDMKMAQSAKDRQGMSIMGMDMMKRK